jgi:hypothetical protein
MATEKQAFDLVSDEILQEIGDDVVVTAGNLKLLQHCELTPS